MTKQPKTPVDKTRDWRSGNYAQTFSHKSALKESKEEEGPSMSRARVQLATAYAPDTLFTWEGAKGICRSVPVSRPALDIKAATRRMVFEGIHEAADNWKVRALAVRDPGYPMDLVLDDVFYEQRSGDVLIDEAKDFKLTRPDRVGYIPFPLLYRCGVCGKLHEYESVNQQASNPLPKSCGNHEARWSQVDVVYVHWSGGLEPLSPFRNQHVSATGDVTRIDRCDSCGSSEFRLHNHAPVFSEWSFVCLGCGAPRDLKQNDRRTLRHLKPRIDRGDKHEWIEIHMLPVSYRANSAYYVQKGSFIDFEDPRVVDLLTTGQQRELLRTVALMHGFAYNEPSEDDIRDSLAKAGKPNEYKAWRLLLDTAQQLRDLGVTATADETKRKADLQRDSWFADGTLDRGTVRSAALAAAVALRGSWAKRFDPLRLTVEHDTFVREHINQRMPTAGAVDVLNPDRQLSDAAGDAKKIEAYRNTIGRSLRAIGISQMTLIRGLPICEYSFGYSRVSPTPTYLREHGTRSKDMPVRLNAFPYLPESTHHPVYILEQHNEALYIRLDEARVRAWLEANGVADIPLPGKPGIGGAYLEGYNDFGPYLDDFKGHEGKAGADRDLCPYIYLLLHSLSHQIVHAIAEMSGLDRDSIGEHIFPADLAFVVYRKGMTPDLGNISAMWRNHAAAFLQRVLEPRMLRCGSGSLCDSRGGACPACIMLPDLTCTASNQLLSRSALKGGPPPTWEDRMNAALVGYFDPRFNP